MFRALSTAATGMHSQQLIVDTVANNIANMNTAGFKRSQVDFHDLLYIQMRSAGGQSAGGIQRPTGLEIGTGVMPASTLKVFSEGELEITERPLDVAIQGDGFIQVSMPDGETRYTRDGSLRLNANGNLVTASGYYVSPGITFPSDAQDIQIAMDGTVSCRTGGSTSLSQVGQLTLARFANPAGLKSQGNNLYSESDASGSATTGTPGSSGMGTLQQSALERSNVQVVTELVRLITAQRAYEINARTIRAGDEMLSMTNQILS